MYSEKNCTSVNGLSCQGNSIKLHVQDLFCAKFLRYSKEHYFRSYQALSVCPSGKSSLKIKKMSSKHWCNDIDRGKPKYAKKNVSQCHSASQKSHRDWPATET